MTALTTLKIAALAPMPSASVTSAAVRECRRPHERAPAVAKVLQGGFEPRHPALLAVDFLHRCDSSEMPIGGAPRLIRRQAAAHVLLGHHVEVKLHLVVQIAIERSLSDQAGNPGEQRAQHQSALSAIAGSTFSARSAGMTCATIATAASAAIDAPSDSGSMRGTPNNRDSSELVSAAAPARPINSPSVTLFSPVPSTRRMMSSGFAPSATRTPTSRVRCATTKAMTP